MASRQKPKGSFKLRDALECRLTVAKFTCGCCRITRYFATEDLLKLMGNVECDDAETKMRCVKCGNKDYLRGKFDELSAADLQHIRVRRIHMTYYVRKVIWKDG